MVPCRPVSRGLPINRPPDSDVQRSTFIPNVCQWLCRYVQQPHFATLSQVKLAPAGSDMWYPDFGSRATWTQSTAAQCDSSTRSLQRGSDYGQRWRGFLTLDNGAMSEHGYARWWAWCSTGCSDVSNVVPIAGDSEIASLQIQVRTSFFSSTLPVACGESSAELHRHRVPDLLPPKGHGPLVLQQAACGLILYSVSSLLPTRISTAISRTLR